MLCAFSAGISGGTARMRCCAALRATRPRASSNHRTGVWGDYDDFADEEALLRFIRNGK